MLAADGIVEFVDERQWGQPFRAREALEYLERGPRVWR